MLRYAALHCIADRIAVERSSAKSNPSDQSSAQHRVLYLSGRSERSIDIEEGNYAPLLSCLCSHLRSLHPQNASVMESLQTHKAHKAHKAPSLSAHTSLTVSLSSTALTVWTVQTEVAIAKAIGVRPSAPALLRSSADSRKLFARRLQPKLRRRNGFNSSESVLHPSSLFTGDRTAQDY